MRNVLLIFIVLATLILSISGCSSPIAAGGAGVGIGAALQHTITGAKADLAAREQKLIATYNEGVAIGMKQEELDVIEQQIRDTQLAKETVDTGEQLFGIDWSDPKETGGAIGILTSLALLWFNRRKLKTTTKELVGKTEGINKFCGTSPPEVAGKLHDIVKDKLAQ